MLVRRVQEAQGQSGGFYGYNEDDFDDEGAGCHGDDHDDDGGEGDDEDEGDEDDLDPPGEPPGELVRPRSVGIVVLLYRGEGFWGRHCFHFLIHSIPCVHSTIFSWPHPLVFQPHPLLFTAIC